MIDVELNLDRLHDTITQIYEEGVGCERGRGYSTAFLSLLLGEAQLSDVGTCVVYVGVSEADASYKREQFIHDIVKEPGLIILRHTYQQICVLPGRQMFFFVGAEYMTQRFSFLGTRVDRLYLDVPRHMMKRALWEKLLMLKAHGTEITG